MKHLIEVNFIEHGRVVLTNEKRDTYNSRSEELIDFLHGLKDDTPKEAVIVHGNEAGKETCEMWQREYDWCRGLLQNLVNISKDNSPLAAAMLAKWNKQAEEFLKNYQHFENSTSKRVEEIDIKQKECSCRHQPSYRRDINCKIHGF